ncbi:MAG: FixH family protein [Actinomycetota bacterium]|nr:FixH family protein [Actinomycetota bacterium]
MTGIWRLSAVAMLAMVAFGVAVVSFKEVPAKECQMDSVRDAAYKAEFLEKPTVDLTSHDIAVTRAGTPVSGAQVCMRADMGGPGNMSGMGVSDEAREVSDGRYRVPVRFEMGGHWNATVVVAEPRKEPVRIQMALQVE